MSRPDGNWNRELGKVRIRRFVIGRHISPIKTEFFPADIRSEGLLEESEGRLEGSEGRREGSNGQLEGSEGQLKEGRTYRRADKRNFSDFVPCQGHCQKKAP